MGREICYELSFCTKVLIYPADKYKVWEFVSWEIQMNSGEKKVFISSLRCCSSLLILRFFYFKTGSILLMADLLAAWICEGVEKSVIIFTLPSAFDFACWTLCNTRKTCEA